jgi:hypothetical protein
MIGKSNLILIGLGLALGITLMYFFQKPTIKEIEVPYEVVVELPAITNTIKGDPYPVPYKVEVAVENPLNMILSQKYEEANDSIKKLLYMMAVAQKEYNLQYKDSVQIIEVYTKVANGEIINQSIDYNIFPKKQTITGTTTVKIPVYNKLYYGFEVSNRFELNYKPSFAVGIILKTKKENIWKVSFDTNEELTLGFYTDF